MRRAQREPLGEFKGRSVPPVAHRYRHIAAYYSQHGESQSAVELTRGLRQVFRLRVLNAHS